MAFTTTAGSAEYVKSGTPGVAGIYTTKRKYSLSDMIVLQERYWAKLDTALRMEMATVNVDDPEPKVLVEQEAPVKLNIRSDGSTTTLDEDTLKISDTQAKFLQAGDRLQLPDVFCDSDGANYTTTKFGGGYMPETIIVESVTLSGVAAGVASVVVARGNGYRPTSSVTTILSEYKIIRMGNILHDGGDAPAPISFEPTDTQNFCEFRSEVWGETEVEKPINVYGKETMEQKARKAYKKFFREQEYMFFFGRKGKQTGAGGNIRWLSGGLVEFLPNAAAALDGVSRLINFAGAFDLQLWREKMEIVHRYGSERKDHFVGGKFFTVLYNALESFITVNDEFSQRYGWTVNQLELGHGIDMLHRHPLFTDQATASNDYSMDDAIVDMAYIKQMLYIDVSYKQNIQTARSHKREDELYSQVGLWRTFPSAHAYIYGITG